MAISEISKVMREKGEAGDNVSGNPKYAKIRDKIVAFHKNTAPKRLWQGDNDIGMNVMAVDPKKTGKSIEDFLKTIKKKKSARKKNKKTEDNIKKLDKNLEKFLSEIKDVRSFD